LSNEVQTVSVLGIGVFNVIYPSRGDSSQSIKLIML
jgi:hypothetical protein